MQNQSERYEGRFVSVKIEQSPSVLFAGMAGSVIPIVTAHGRRLCRVSGCPCGTGLQRVGVWSRAATSTNHHQVTEQYPLNPNGSPLGMTRSRRPPGRATILMPHPERVHRTVALSWHPPEWGEDSPWMKLFYNARDWVG